MTCSRCFAPATHRLKVTLATGRRIDELSCAPCGRPRFDWFRDQGWTLSSSFDELPETKRARRAA